MKKTNLDYESVVPDIDETQFDDLDISDRVLKLAQTKAAKVAAEHQDAFVIAADTLTQDPATGQVFTKPKDPEEQYRQALNISGKSVGVFSGVCIYFQGKELESVVIESAVHYQEFDSETFDRLAHGDNPHIRSSTLGMFIDSPGFTLVEHVEGSYTGSMGLPTEVVYRNLRKIKQVAEQ